MKGPLALVGLGTACFKSGGSRHAMPQEGDHVHSHTHTHPSGWTESDIRVVGICFRFTAQGLNKILDFSLFNLASSYKWLPLIIILSLIEARLYLS